MITGAVIFFLSQAMDMSVFVTNVASMIGIGVAVDYSLFILARYREEIRAGASPEDARRTAMRTSGVAVVFSGLTVIISLAGLFLVDSTTIRSMALGRDRGRGGLDPRRRDLPARADAGCWAAAPTCAGARRWSWRCSAAACAGAGAGRGSTDPEAQRAGFWQRWTDRVTRRPVVAAARERRRAARARHPRALARVRRRRAAPVPRGQRDARRRRAGRQASSAPARPGPTQLVATFDSGTASDRAQPRRARALAPTTCARDPEVGAGRAARSPRATAAPRCSRVAPAHDPESAEARAMVDRLRDGAGRGRSHGWPTSRSGGATAAVEDFKDLVSGSMWKIALFVLAFSYLVLFVLLRSVLLPLKAVLMNLLSVGAAYGVLVRSSSTAGSTASSASSRSATSTRSRRRSCWRSCSASRWTTRCSC